MSIFISLGIYSQKGADGIINGDSLTEKQLWKKWLAVLEVN